MKNKKKSHVQCYMEIVRYTEIGEEGWRRGTMSEIDEINRGGGGGRARQQGRGLCLRILSLPASPGKHWSEKVE